MTTSCPFCNRFELGQFEPTTDLAVISFQPLNPVTPGHMLFLPKTHLADARTDPVLTGRVFEAASRYAGSRAGACNLITSAGAAATQTVWHLHVHYVPRQEGDGLPLPWTGQVREAANGG